MRKELRSWQKEALTVYLRALEQERRSILWEATPGAGKTVAAMRVCLHQLKQAQARRVLVVVPTTHLKTQWARAAAEHSLHLDSEFGESHRRLARDYHGAVLTYQQIGNAPERFRAVSERAVIVLDEVHHSGDGLSWGNALRIALKGSSFILCLSGTAFRSDNNPIPFIRYNEAGVSEPDYVYSYAKAVEDAVCRPTVFFTYGGEVSWSDGRNAAVRADFGDALDRVGRTRRLRAALDPDSGWLEPMLRDADRMLGAVRQDQPEAGGLLVASSQTHARQVAKLLSSICGIRPTVVLSEDARAGRKLKDFAQGDSPWLVACNMVSEGVDIPRLRLGVYATAIRTKMYFRQFLGRIVRRTPTPLGTQPAFFYLPADPWLHRLAEEVELEQRHCLNARPLDEFQALDLEPRERRESEAPSWQSLGGVNSGIDSVILGGGQLSLWQEPASELPSALGELRNAPPLTGEQILSRAEMKEEIAREIRNLVARYHRDSGQPHSHIHALLNRKQSVKSQKECTENQLRERLQLLEGLLQEEIA